MLYEQAGAVRRALAAPPVRAPQGLADRIVTAAAKLPQKPASGPAPADDQPDDAQAPGRSAEQGKVLPALLLALCLLPALTPPALMLGEPDLPISLSL